MNINEPQTPSVPRQVAGMKNRDLGRERKAGPRSPCPISPVEQLKLGGKKGMRESLPRRRGRKISADRSLAQPA
jgi:hypothetical protein